MAARRRRECLLKAIGRVAAIAQQPVSRLPHRRPVFSHNVLPVIYLQVVPSLGVPLPRPAETFRSERRDLRSCLRPYTKSSRAPRLLHQDGGLGKEREMSLEAQKSTTFSEAFAFFTCNLL